MRNWLVFLPNEEKIFTGFFACPVRPYTITRWLTDGETIEVRTKKSRLEVVQTPGHTPDSLCLIYTEIAADGFEEVSLFAGDLIYTKEPVYVASVGGSTNQFEESMTKLIDRLSARISKKSKFVGIRCGHVDDTLEFDWLNRMQRLVRAVNGRGGERVRASGWPMRAYEIQDDVECRGLSFAVFKLSWLLGLSRPWYSPKYA